MWATECTFYQFYTLGFCGAPPQNDGITVPRIAHVVDWIPHLQKLQVGGVYFTPIFSSDAHGYDTRDYQTVDCRLGTNADFIKVCHALHDAKIRIVLDGVFHHVGRGFWAFRDVQEKKWDSPYKDWFLISFDGNSCYNDGFWYEGWEGHFELVKLNLHNPAVVDYLLTCVGFWMDTFGIDGLRLDVAYLLEPDFIRRLHHFCKSKNPDFFLLGEMIHGDYNRLLGDGLLDSCTNYECYKGLHSSLNSMNLFEIVHSLQRQFGAEPWTLYRGKHLWSFVDNHDVNRIASILQNPAQLPLIYGLMIGMPGIPCIYYGSEWGIQGEKQGGSDAPLRPFVQTPDWNELTEAIARMVAVRAQSKALQDGSFRSLLLTNRQAIFERAVDGERVLVAINADATPFVAHFDAGAGRAEDLITHELHDFGGGSTLDPYRVYYWRIF